MDPYTSKKILLHLLDNGDQNVKYIAKGLHKRSANVSAALWQLKKKDFVENTGPGYYRLTPAGRAEALEFAEQANALEFGKEPQPATVIRESDSHLAPETAEGKPSAVPAPTWEDRYFQLLDKYERLALAAHNVQA